MKKLFVVFIFCLVFLFTGNVTAEESCIRDGKLAEAIMGLRQNGIPLHVVLERTINFPIDNFADKKKQYPEEFKALADGITKMVMDAYDTPPFSTEKHKKEAITEFGNKYMLKCLKSRE